MMRDNIVGADGQKLHPPAVVQGVLDRFWAAGYEAYLVGGCVRDSLLGTEPDDYDIASSATPEEVKALFADDGASRWKLIETGLKHGTLTLLSEGMPLEITTFRRESGYSDGRHPDAVAFTRSLPEDLSRRDFTINAMAYESRTGLVDPFGGKDDLASGLIRAVGEPEKRFSEDALRILRALRFSAVLGFPLEAKTEAAARCLSQKLLRISAERVAVELKKLLTGKDVLRVLLQYTDILGVVLPELLPMKGFDQRNRHHIYDVLTHTAHTVAALPADPLLRMAGLFHDAGKPAVFSLDEEGVGHFYGHASRSAALAEEALTRLKWDSAGKSEIVRLVRWHDLPIEATEKGVRRALGKMTPDFLEKLLLLKRADNLAQHPAYHDRQKVISSIEALAKDILARQECFSLRDLALNGDDLLALGMKPGRALGLTLKRLLSLVVDGELPNERNALLFWVRENLPADLLPPNLLQKGNPMEIHEILSRCDHTQLAVTATWEEVRALCDEGMAFGTATVCIPPCYIRRAREYVKEKLRLCTVIGFPNGYATTAVKVFETKDAIAAGADEIDMVIPIGALKAGDDALVQEEIQAVKAACGDKILKVIVETCLLTEEEKRRAGAIVTAAGADYIKTSTGFAKGGATKEDVALLRATVGENVRVKAAGGISSLEDAEEMIAAGADRLGTSRLVKAARERLNQSASEPSSEAGDDKKGY